MTRPNEPFSAVERLAEAVLENRVKVYATSTDYHGNSQTTFDIIVEPREDPAP